MKKLQSSSGLACSASLRRRPLVVHRLALSALLSVAVLPAVAAPITFTDSYTLSTSNQSMWGSGAQAGWSYDSGLIGSAWGTYSGVGAAADTFGINLIAGSQNSTVIPGTPEACAFGICIGGTDPVTADTRTGGSLNGTTSGRLGVDVYAEANGGALNVVAPMVSTMTVGDAGANGVFRVSGSSALGAGATITASAPSFKAGVDGVINLNASISATGCFFLAGCTTSSTLNLPGINPGQFSLVALDTSKSAPVSIFGLDVPQISFDEEYVYRFGELPCQGPATSDGQAPKCDTTPFGTPALGVVKIDSLQDYAGGSISGNTLSLTKNQPVLRVTADITGLAQQALGFTVDVLNPSLSLSPFGTANFKSLNIQAGLQFGLTQEFDFTPRVLTLLEFDKPVTEYVRVLDYYECLIPIPEYLGGGCLVNDTSRPVYKIVQIDRGTSVLVDLASGADLKFTGAQGQLVERTYMMASNSMLTSDARLSIDPTLPIAVGCMDFDSNVPGFNPDSLCAFEEDFRTTDLASFSVFKKEFSLQGFDMASFAAGGPGGGDPPLNVPEPSSLWLLMLALGPLGVFGVRRLLQAQARLAT